VELSVKDKAPVVRLRFSVPVPVQVRVPVQVLVPVRALVSSILAQSQSVWCGVSVARQPGGVPASSGGETHSSAFHTGGVSPLPGNRGCSGRNPEISQLGSLPICPICIDSDDENSSGASSSGVPKRLRVESTTVVSGKQSSALSLAFVSSGPGSQSATNLCGKAGFSAPGNTRLEPIGPYFYDYDPDADLDGYLPSLLVGDGIGSDGEGPSNPTPVCAVLSNLTGGNLSSGSTDGQFQPQYLSAQHCMGTLLVSSCGGSVQPCGGSTTMGSGKQGSPLLPLSVPGPDSQSATNLCGRAGFSALGNTGSTSHTGRVLPPSKDRGYSGRSSEISRPGSLPTCVNDSNDGNTSGASSSGVPKRLRVKRTTVGNKKQGSVPSLASASGSGSQPATNPCSRADSSAPEYDPNTNFEDCLLPPSVGNGIGSDGEDRSIPALDRTEYPTTQKTPQQVSQASVSASSTVLGVNDSSVSSCGGLARFRAAGIDGCVTRGTHNIYEEEALYVKKLELARLEECKAYLEIQKVFGKSLAGDQIGSLGKLIASFDKAWESLGDFVISTIEDEAGLLDLLSQLSQHRSAFLKEVKEFLSGVVPSIGGVLGDSDGPSCNWPLLKGVPDVSFSFLQGEQPSLCRSLITAQAKILFESRRLLVTRVRRLESLPRPGSACERSKQQFSGSHHGILLVNRKEEEFSKDPDVQQGSLLTLMDTLDGELEEFLKEASRKLDVWPGDLLVLANTLSQGVKAERALRSLEESYEI